MAITEQQVKDALQTLVDPNTQKDFITTKSARNIKVNGNDVKYDSENTGYGFAVTKKIDAWVATRPTSCQMKRP